MPRGGVLFRMSQFARPGAAIEARFSPVDEGEHAGQVAWAVVEVFEVHSMSAGRRQTGEEVRTLAGGFEDDDLIAASKAVEALRAIRATQRKV